MKKLIEFYVEGCVSPADYLWPAAEVVSSVTKLSILVSYESNFISHYLGKK